jgi:excisionase family DNA binding protein
VDELKDQGLAKIAEVRAFLQVCRATVYELLRKRELEAVRIGRSVRVTWDSVHAFVGRHRVV